MSGTSLTNATNGAAPHPRSKGRAGRALYRIKRWHNRLNARFFGSRPNGTEAYKELVRQACQQAEVVLHLGSGWDRTAVFGAQMYAGRQILALDPDRASVLHHRSPYRMVGVGEALPVRDASIDLIASEYVFEHLEEPLEVIRECARVLRPGGRLIVVTPNGASYFGLLSKLTPFRFHVWFLERLLDKPAEDTYPTYYRVNTRKKVLELSQAANLRVAHLETIVGPPIYTTPLPVLHLLFIGVHKILELSWFQRWGLRLVMVLERPEVVAEPVPAAAALVESRSARG